LPEEIACDILAFKISLAIAFTSLLIIPVLIKPVNGLYDIAELESLRAYCYLHADRAAQGENVVNDLIKSGLASSTFQDWSCSKISETLQAEQNAESQRQLAESQRQQDYANDCKHGNLTPPQYWECDRAGYPPNGFICLFEEDREEAAKRIADGDLLPIGALGNMEELDLSLAQPLTPDERQECLNTGHEPLEEEDKVATKVR
jgi:hypothetical protein